MKATHTARAEAPEMLDLVLASEKQTLAALERVRDAVGTEAYWMREVKPAPKGWQALADAYLKQLMPEWSEVRARVGAEAIARGDFSMLDYGIKRGFDIYAAAFAPYYYWGSRQARNYAIRIMENPVMLANYVRYRDAMEDWNNERGSRKRFEGGWDLGKRS